MSLSYVLGWEYDARDMVPRFTAPELESPGSILGRYATLMESSQCGRYVMIMSVDCVSEPTKELEKKPNESEADRDREIAQWSISHVIFMSPSPCKMWIVLHNDGWESAISLQSLQTHAIARAV